MSVFKKNPNVLMFAYNKSFLSNMDFYGIRWNPYFIRLLHLSHAFPKNIGQ